jgi:hypothetical protein
MILLLVNLTVSCSAPQKSVLVCSHIGTQVRRWPPGGLPLDLEDIILDLGIHMSCNRTRVLRELYHSKGDPRTAYKRSHYTSDSGDPDPLHTWTSQALYSPFITLVPINIKSLDMELLSLRRGWNRINPCVFCSWDQFKTGNMWSCRHCYLLV